MNGLVIALVVLSPLVIGFLALGAGHVYEGGTWGGWAKSFPRLVAGLVVVLGSAAVGLAVLGRLF